MKIALIAAFLCVAAAMPQVRRIQNLQNSNRIPGEFLVVLHESAYRINNAQYAGNVAAQISAISPKIKILNSFTNLKHPIIHLKTQDEKVMPQLFALPEVNIIESNIFQKMIDQCESQLTTDRIWGLSRVAVEQRPTDWASASYSFSSDEGSGVRVYVLDTSIRLTHEDFGGRAVFGFNAVGGSDDDNNGHGTHCAGTVGGSQYGVAKGATLVAVKVLNDGGSGSFAQIIAGIDYAVGDAGSSNDRGVISMSLGGGRNEGLDSAVNDADAAGVPVVASAGNSNGDACFQSPAGAEMAITVGATDINDVLSSFSNYGECVNILAPGTNILSAGHTSDTASRTLSGTSMSCPHVAGYVAKFLSDNPAATGDDVREFILTDTTPDVIDLRGTGSATPNLFMHSTCE